MGVGLLEYAMANLGDMHGSCSITITRGRVRSKEPKDLWFLTPHSPSSDGDGRFLEEHWECGKALRSVTQWSF